MSNSVNSFFYNCNNNGSNNGIDTNFIGNVKIQNNASTKSPDVDSNEVIYKSKLISTY